MHNKTEGQPTAGNAAPPVPAALPPRGRGGAAGFAAPVFLQGVLKPDFSGIQRR